MRFSLVFSGVDQNIFLHLSPSYYKIIDENGKLIKLYIHHTKQVLLIISVCV